MDLNSCIYEVKIWHERRSPKVYGFTHQIFMFYLDLDELPKLYKASWMIGYNSWGIYDFKDRDHIRSHGQTAKESVLNYVKDKGLKETVAKVKLLTNLRAFGYIFNPVSFYFCFDALNKPLCAVAEIGNTFGELKYFYLGPDKISSECFVDQQTKYYYISPFTDLDNQLEFRIQVPDGRMNIAIDVLKNKEKFYLTTMTAKRSQAITSDNLLWATLKSPLVTLKVIVLIHWHAAVLHFAKKIPHHAKEENPQLQREVYREWHKN